jgi:hypothetical protein
MDDYAQGAIAITLGRVEYKGTESCGFIENGDVDALGSGKEQPALGPRRRLMI